MSEENTQIISEEHVKQVEEKKKNPKRDEESTQKKKNPKRVEQGKKLAEWNRKNKKEEPAEAEEIIGKAFKQIDSSKLNYWNYWLLGGGALFIMGLYFPNRETQVVPQEAQIVQQIVPQRAKPTYPFDPFVME